MESARRKVERFEDLIAWQKARALTQAIYQITRQEAFAKDFGLVRQIRNASVSIMSNIAEGFDRGNRNEFHQFLTIAKGSSAEVRSQLYVALDAEFISTTQFEKLLAQAEEVGRVVGGLRAAVAKQRTNR
jgi:four helix bundle protein